MKVVYLDKNDFNKKYRALRRYFMRCYKYIMFKLIPTLQKENKENGRYVVELPSGDLFNKVYGPMKVLFTVENDVAILEDIQPSELLMKCFERDMPIYKGIPYRTRTDLKKLKMMEVILCQQKN